jgi:hypothetical protein
MHTTKTIVNGFSHFFRGGLRKSCVFAHTHRLSLVPIAGHAFSENALRFFNSPSKSGPTIQEHQWIIVRSTA